MTGNENPNRDKMIEDHVLCALFGWLDGGAKEDVKKLATSVFQFEELRDAMLKFWDPDGVVGTIKPKNHNKVETCFEENFTHWDKLQKSKTLPRAVEDSL